MGRKLYNLYLQRQKMRPTITGERLRASICGLYWYCGEKARLASTGVRTTMTEFLAFGETGHEAIQQIEDYLYPWELEFHEKLKTYIQGEYGFTRKIFTAQNEEILVTGHPDCIRISPDKTVFVVERKVLTKADKKPNEYLIKRFFRSMAAVQVQVYDFILAPIIQSLNAKMSNTHAVIFYDHNLNPQFCYLIYRDEDIEKQLLQIFENFKKPETIKPPKSWKCRKCEQQFKKECRFARFGYGK